MANSRKQSTSTKNKNMNSKWLNNAMKSIGISTQEALKDIYPNISEVASTSASTTKNVISTLKNNHGGVNRVSDTLRSNKYVQFASKAYKNAMSDLKSGNFNNQDRMMSAMGFDMDSFDMDDFKSVTDDTDVSFGDDESKDVKVNYINSGVGSEAFIELSSGIQKQSEAILKTNKASMDAMVAVSSAGMFQAERMGSEIIGHLSNISSGIDAMVQYNNENMTKFIEASMSYYEQVGRKMDEPDYGSQRVKPTDIFNNRSGGINISQYKNYVKQQLKATANASGAGLLSMIDDDMIEMAVSNPLGFASQSMVSYMIPKIVGTTIDSVEKTFSSFVPNMLNRMADWGDEYASGIIGNAKKILGKTFGLRVEKPSAIRGASIERGAVPFDGETKHAITEIITKELREQTSYLKAIANHYKIDTNKAKLSGEVWNYDTNSYIPVKQVQETILSSIHDSIVNTFKNDGENSFGKELQKMVTNESNPENAKSLEHSIDELIVALTNTTKHVNPLDQSSDSEYQKVLRSLSSNKKNKKNVDNINAYIQEMARKNPAAFNDLSRNIITAKQARNDSMTDIGDNPSYYNLWASGLNNNEQIYDLMDQQYGYGKYNTSSSVKRGYRRASVEGATVDNGRGVIGRMASVGANSLNKQMTAVMHGNSKEAVNEFMSMVTKQTKILGSTVSKNFLSPIKSMLFGKKDSQGYSSDGIFSGAKNSMNDFVGMMKHQITGKEWTDSKNNKHETTDNSVYGHLSKMGDTVKKGVMEKLFGREKVDKDGNTTGEREKSGVLASVVDSFHKGLEGWKTAFLGKELSDDDNNKLNEKISKKMEDIMPASMTGATVGAGIGLLSGAGILGTLVGGPIGGAAFGMAGGLLAKSKKFQDWLFGEEVDGNRTGGMISKKTQDFMKENKNFLVGGAAVGAASGALGISGGGILGTLVGGPIAGAMTGFASSIILRSNTFKEFLYGSEKSGQKGIINAVKDAFNKHKKQTDKTAFSEGGKLLGMSTIGAGAGMLTASIIGKMGIMGAALTPLGPVGGALAGLGLSIAAQGKNFKTWLFGETVDEDGKKVRKQGAVGQFGNMLNATIFRPMAHEVSYLVKDIGLSVKHDVLTPLSFVAEDISDKVGGVFETVTDKVTTVFNGIGDNIKKNFSGVLQKVFSPIGKIAVGATEMVTKGIKNMALMPANLVKLGLTVVNSRVAELTKPVRTLLKDIRKTIFKGLGKLFKYTMTGIGGVLNIATAPLRGLGSLIGKGVGAVNSRVQDAMIARNINPVDWGTTEGSFSERWQRARKNAKTERAQLEQEKATWKIHDKNAQLIAKYTGNQYSADTEEGRNALKRADYDAWKKLNTKVDTEDAEKLKAKVDKEGSGTTGMTPDQLSKANVSKLNEEGKQTFYLKGIFDVLRGKERSDTDTPTENKSGNEGILKSTLNPTIPEETSDSTVDNDINPDGEKEGFLSRTKKYWGNELADAKSWFGEVAGRQKTEWSALKDRLAERKQHDAAKRAARRGGQGGGFGEGDNTDVFSSQTPKAMLPVYVADISNKVAENLGGDPSELEKARLKDQENDAKIAQVKADNAKNALSRAIDLGTTAEEKKKQIAEEQNAARLDDIRGSMKEQVDVSKEHSKQWSSIFSKKGLITGALVLLSPLLLKAVKWLLGNGSSLLSSIAGGISSFVGGSVSDAIRTEVNDDRKDGMSAAEVVGSEIDNTKSAVKKLSRGNVVGAATEFVTNEDGEWDHSSYAKTKLIAQSGNVAKLGGKALGKTKVGKAATSLYNSNIGSAVRINASNTASKLVQSGKTKIAGLTTKASEGITKIATKANDGIIGKVSKYVKEFFSKVLTGVKSKLGKSVSTAAVAGIEEGVQEGIEKGSKTIATKAGALLSSTAALASTVVGLAAKEATWVTLGAINGATGAARLFQVDSEYVDAKMVVISTIIGGFNGSTVGSIVDIVNEVVAGITGVDFVSQLACAIYKAISSDEKDSKLDEGRHTFYNSYLDYKDTAIEDSYAAAIEKGTIDATVTLDAYKAGVDSGTYQAKYDSFVDYNDKQHKTIGAKMVSGIKSAGKGIVSGVKGVGKGISNGVNNIGKGISSGWNKMTTAIGTGATTVKNFLFKHKEKAWYDTNGCYYVANGQSFQYFNQHGDLINDSVDADTVEQMITAGTLTEGEITTNSGIKKGLSSLLKSGKETWNTITTGATAIWSSVKSKGGEFIENVKQKGLFAGIKSSITTTTKKVWYDTNGNYYKQNGSDYDYYNANNDIIQSKVSADIVTDKIRAGLLTQGEIIEDSAAKKAVTKIQDAVKDAWNTAKDTVSNGWSKIKSWIIESAPSATTVENTTTSQSSVAANGKITKGMTFGGNGVGKQRRSGGGRGGDTLNGFSYYAQNDSRWGNQSYNEGQDDATLADSGCGPAAMSMVASEMTGSKVDPTQMASLAKATGNRDETGTNWNFVNTAASAYGLNTSQQYSPSAEYISSQLDQGKPMILSGSSTAGGGSGNSAYTPAGHYVVAVGKDRSGNVIVNDPRGKSHSGKYNINQLASQTGAAWAFGGGRGISQTNALKESTASRSGSMKWMDIVKTVKAAIASQHPTYNQSGYITITINNQSERVRTDCSGYVSACLVYYGTFKSGMMTSSYGFSKDSSIISTMQSAGFKKRSFTGWDNLQEGDIISAAGKHVEIFSHNEGTSHKVYSNGSTASMSSATPTSDGNLHTYDTVWSPPENASGSVGSFDATGTTSTDSSSSGSGSIISKIGGFFSEAGSRLLKGIFTGNTNTDFSSYWSGADSSSSTTSNASIPSADNITGSDNAQKVWNYFRSAGYSKEATAGILGNMQQESGVNPTAIQKGSGHAAGIVQWESYKNKSGRWKSMADYAQSKGKDWTDLGSQLEFVHQELQGLDHYFRDGSGSITKAGAQPTTYSEWKNSSNLDAATRQFEGAFERSGKPMMENRIASAKKYYELYGGGAGVGVNKTSISSYKARKSDISTNKNGGGFGIDYSSIGQNQSNNSANAYTTTNRISKSSSTNKENNLINTVIEILTQIAENTSASSDKLDLLKNLNTSSSNTTNYVSTGSNNSTSSQSPNVVGSKTTKASRNSVLASKIASGR